LQPSKLGSTRTEHAAEQARLYHGMANRGMRRDPSRSCRA